MTRNEVCTALRSGKPIEIHVGDTGYVAGCNGKLFVEPCPDAVYVTMEHYETYNDPHVYRADDEEILLRFGYDEITGITTEKRVEEFFQSPTLVVNGAVKLKWRCV